ncbi:dihydrofolate reductase [Nocardia sp. SYP-A9097]|uniref:dihydrofolate reductase family protein n=1 Tax=Nocardia sp. SYP-A9097 TaxID=2663237 RepID=UPI00129B3895|nr:dihydrofolate reductase family protein [Nocardia sp. SYP-A9097]MRH91339.1 dihydrofolate reductase [Nocardia sp. SYP-A9097]
MRKLVYYVAVSLDGYIAGPQGEFDFYPMCDDMTAWAVQDYPETVPTHLREPMGMPIDTPNRVFDTLLMGRGTYEPGLAIGTDSPYNHLKQYVFSSTLAPVANPQVEIVDTDPVDLVRQLKTQPGLDIWLCGGGNLAGQLINEIDQLILKTYPVIAGAGIPALTANFNPTQFKPTHRREFTNGAQATWLDRR